jgi:hypothetical protein
MVGQPCRLIGAVTERTALLLVQASPDAPLIGGDRVLETVDLDRTVGADSPSPGARIAVGREAGARACWR